MEGNKVLIRPRVLIWLILFIASVVGVYCLLAIFAISSLSGAPNYSYERAKWNEHFWGLGFLASVLISGLSTWFLVKSRRR